MPEAADQERDVQVLARAHIASVDLVEEVDLLRVLLGAALGGVGEGPAENQPVARARRSWNEDSHRLCYARGPEGDIIELAEQIGHAKAMEWGEGERERLRALVEGRSTAQADGQSATDAAEPVMAPEAA